MNKHPSRRRVTALKPDGTPDNNDRVEIGPTTLAFSEWKALGLEIPHLDTMREFRLQRLCNELRNRDYGGILLFDPLNIRYATDSTNMQLWTSHNPARACFVSADGYIVLWEFHSCDHLSAHLPLVRELRAGAGLCDEYPAIYYPEDLEDHGYDGVVEAGMVFCVEAYIGAVGAKNGVKLEDQVLVTEDGFEEMSKYPFEQALLE